MGFLEGLDAINELLEGKKSGGDYAERQKAEWVQLKGGEDVKLAFLQEIDRGSERFSEKNGLAKFVLEHSGKEANWKKTAECTASEGKCWACENGYSQKASLVVNALVDDGKREPYVAIFKRAIGKGSVAKTLLKIAADDGMITDVWFQFSREGKTKDDTTYMLMQKKEHKLNVEDYELWDLTQATFKVDYDRQEAYYLDGQVTSEPTVQRAQPVAAGSSSVDVDW